MNCDELNNILFNNFNEKDLKDIKLENTIIKSSINYDLKSEKSIAKKKQKQSDDTEKNNKKDFLRKKTLRKDNVRSKVLNHFFKF